MGCRELAEEPEGDGRSGADVEGVDAVVHRDADHEVGGGYDVGGKAVSLGTEEDTALLIGRKPEVGHRNAVVAKGHAYALEAMGLQRGKDIGIVAPGNLENGTHRDADTASVEGVARLRREDHTVEAESCSRAENHAYIGGITNVINHTHPPPLL